MRESFKKYRKPIADAMLNIIASAIPLALLQLLILPGIGNTLGQVKYGAIVTLLSLTTLIAFPLGNALNNVRLIQCKEYEDKRLSGDFNLLLLISVAADAVFTLAGCIYYASKETKLDIVLIIIITILTLAREYYTVAFRLILNYKAILVNNIILAAGYSLGYLLFVYSHIWEFIYIIGTLFSLIYIFFKTDLPKEPLKKTELFRGTFNKDLVLILSSFMGQAVNYADRLLLFPLLGAAAVSVYYSATIFSKIISMGISPISSVMLSYFAKMEKFSRKYFYSLLLISALFGIAGFGICILISKPLLFYFYPKWAAQSMPLVYVTAATAIFSAIASIINPVILKFCNINWQIVIAAVKMVLYVGFALLFFEFYGLMGFCIGIFIATVVDLLLKIIIFMFKTKKDYAKEANE